MKSRNLKRFSALLLSIVMLFVSMPGFDVTLFASAEDSASSVSDYLYVVRTDLSESQIKYTVYLKENVSVSGATVIAEFDEAAFKVVSGGSAGTESLSVPGIYIADYHKDSQNKYVIANVNINTFNSGSNEIPYMEFVFEMLSPDVGYTNINIYCNEFSSDDDSQINIPMGSEELFYNEVVVLDELSQNGFCYRLNENGDAILTGYVGNESDFVIPSDVEGYTVVGIGNKAFSGTEGITNITIPETVVTIGTESFKNCPDLTSVTISDTMENIGTNAFAGCENISVIYYYSTPQVWGEINGFDCGISSGNVKFICDIENHIAVTDAAVSPTCTQTGLTEGSHCSRCGETLVLQKKVAALGHVTVIDEAVAQTCTETGLTEGSHCSRCNEVLVAQKVILARGHSYTFKTITDSTCTTVGLGEYKCVFCGDSYTETIPFKDHSYAEEIIEATCTQTGYTIFTCTQCSYAYKGDYTDFAPCRYTETVVTEATCVQTGLIKHECEACGAMYSKVTPLGDHSFGDTVFTWSEDGSSATATKICKLCNESETVDAAIVTVDDCNFVAIAEFSNGDVEKSVYTTSASYEVIDGGKTVAQFTNEYFGEEFAVDIIDFYGKKLEASDLVGSGAVVIITEISTEQIISVGTVVVMGDVNGDGAVDTEDKKISSSVMLGEKEYSVKEDCFFLANDITQDGVIDAIDAAMLNSIIRNFKV